MLLISFNSFYNINELNQCYQIIHDFSNTYKQPYMANQKNGSLHRTNTSHNTSCQKYVFLIQVAVSGTIEYAKLDCKQSLIRIDSELHQYHLL